MFFCPVPFFSSLIRLGLIADECNFCHSHDLTLTFDKEGAFPRARCKCCAKRCESLRKASIFEKHGINNILGFIFVDNCFVLNVPFEATVLLSGLAEGTVRSYKGHIREMVNAIVEKKNRAIEGQLGREGKIVEIDKAFLTKKKYGRGRIPAGAETIVFGMTERDGGLVRVEDPYLLCYLMRKEAFRTEVEAKKNKSGLRPPQEPPRLRRRQRPADDEVFITEGDFTTVLNIGDDADSEDFEIPDDGDEVPAAEPHQQHPRRFAFDREMEAKERQPFGTVDRSKQNRTLCFVVKDRKAETLLPIIRKYVKPGTIIFSDKWSAYFWLDGEFEHFVVVHESRFVK